MAVQGLWTRRHLGGTPARPERGFSEKVPAKNGSGSTRLQELLECRNYGASVKKDPPPVDATEWSSVPCDGFSALIIMPLPT